MDQVAAGGVPDLQRQIVGGCDDRAVVAVPRYHGDFQLCHLVFQRRRVVLPVNMREVNIDAQMFYGHEIKMYC